MTRINRNLSKREIEILDYYSHGLNYIDISGVLGISNKTVRHHMQNLRYKLNANHMGQAVALAYKTGILETENETKFKHKLRQLLDE